MNCQNCHLPLNVSVYSEDGKLKSCPSCSVADADEHVFWSCPDGFGTSPKRVNADNPIGVQSHCAICRTLSVPTTGGKRCSAVGASGSAPPPAHGSSRAPSPDLSVDQEGAYV